MNLRKIITAFQTTELPGLQRPGKRIKPDPKEPKKDRSLKYAQGYFKEGIVDPQIVRLIRDGMRPAQVNALLAHLVKVKVVVAPQPLEVKTKLPIDRTRSISPRALPHPLTDEELKIILDNSSSSSSRNPTLPVGNYGDDDYWSKPEGSEPRG